MNKFEKIPDINTEKQFITEKEKIELDGKLFEITDVHPEKEKTDVPVMFAPGFVCGPETYKHNIQELAENGRRCMMIDAPHGVSMENIDAERKNNVLNQEKYEMKKAVAFIKALDERKIDKTDAVGHSEGCISVVIAAALYPERFRNLVLVNPGGMIGKDSLIPLIIRFSKTIIHDYKQGLDSPEIRKRNLEAIDERIKNFFKAKKKN